MTQLETPTRTSFVHVREHNDKPRQSASFISLPDRSDKNWRSRINSLVSKIPSKPPKFFASLKHALLHPKKRINPSTKSPQETDARSLMAQIDILMEEIDELPNKS